MVGNHITIDDPPSVLGRPLTNGINGNYNKMTGLPNGAPVVNGNRNDEGSQKLVIFSSQDEKGTTRQAAQFSNFAAEHSKNFDLEDLTFTLNHKRSSLPWKSFAILNAIEDIKNLSTSISSAQRSKSNPALGFIFTGQGGQWAQMGKELVCYPVFDQRLEEAESYLLELGCPWKLREEMFKPQSESQINKPSLSQPLCTALQIALVDLLSSFGVYPTAVVGHSSGEIAAAYAAGAISAKSAWSVAYYRGVCAAKVVKARTGTNSGAMMAVGLSQETVKPYVERVAKQFGVKGLTIACINSPKNVTISGDAEQIDILKQLLDADKVFARKLMVDVAYHSPHMEEISQEYLGLINDIKKDSEYHREAIMISSVTGERVSPDMLVQPDYWVSNMVSPVRFVDAVSHLFSRSARRIRKKLDLSHRGHFNINWLVELGPHAALQGPVRDILAELPSATNIGYNSVIMRKQAAVSSMITAMGQIKCLGYPVNLDSINYPRGKSRRRPMILPDLPSYPFDHSKGYWFESRLGKHFRTFPQNKLDLLGKPIPDWNPLEAKWRNVIRVSEMPWVEDHVVSRFSNVYYVWSANRDKINGALVYPGAGMLVMAIEGAKQLADATRPIRGFELRDCIFQSALNVPHDSSGIEVQTSLLKTHQATEAKNVWSEFRICAHENGQWQECCYGSIRVEYESAPSEVDNGRERQEELLTAQLVHDSLTHTCATEFDPTSMYRTLNESGFGFGPSFQPITRGRIGEGKQAQADVKLFEWPKGQYPQEHVIHPTSLDGMLHLGIAGAAKGGQSAVPTMIPTAMRGLWISNEKLSFKDDNSHVKACTWIASEDNRGFEVDGLVLDSAETSLLARITGMKLTIVSDNNSNDDDDGEARQICYNVEYRPDPDMCRTKGLRLAKFVDMLGHKKPGLKLLHLNYGDSIDAGLAEEILETLTTPGTKGDRIDPRFSGYHIVASSGANLEETRKRFERFPSVYFHEDIHTNLGTSSFDVVITNRLAYKTSASQNSFLEVYKLLDPRGYLIMSEKNSIRNQVNGNNEESLPASLEGVSVFKRDSSGLFVGYSADDGHVYTVSNGAAVTNATGQKSLYLVLGSETTSQPNLVKKLKSLPQAGLFSDIHTVTLQEAASTSKLEDAVFLVLLELEGPFLHMITPEQYQILQKFLIAKKDVMWVNPYGGRSAGTPEYAIANGIARAMRNEYEDHRFSVLQLSIESKVTHEQICWIYDILVQNHLHIEANPQPEWEYIEIENALNIARVVHNPQLSQDIFVRSLKQHSGRVHLKDAPPLILTIGSPGLLDTLHFVEDELPTKLLGPDEIEIQTHAVGMNFKDCLIALGKVPGNRFGIECSGFVRRAGEESGFQPGDRVLMVGPIATVARTKASAACKIPDSMSFVEALRFPLSLARRGKLSMNLPA